MRNLIRIVPVIIGANFLSSCVVIPRSFPPPTVVERTNFTIYEEDNAIYVTFTDGDKETYRVKNQIYDYLEGRMNEGDHFRLKESRVMRDILETADMDDDYFIGKKDVFLLSLSKSHQRRLIELVNMHYSENNPRLTMR